MHLLLSWLAVSIGLYVTAMLVPGFVVKNGFRGALLVGAVFGVLHYAIGTLLYVLLGVGTLFIGFILSFVTRWIVTAIVLMLTSKLSDTLSIDRFRTALVGSAVLSILTAVSEVLFNGPRSHSFLW